MHINFFPIWTKAQNQLTAGSMAPSSIGKHVGGVLLLTGEEKWREIFNQSQSICNRSQPRKYFSHCVNYWLTRVLLQMLEECCWLWTTAVFMTSLVYLNSTSDSFPIRSFLVPCTNNSLQRDVSICRFINLLQFFTFSCVQLWCSICKVRFSKRIFTLNGCPLLF